MVGTFPAHFTDGETGFRSGCVAEPGLEPRQSRPTTRAGALGKEVDLTCFLLSVAGASQVWGGCFVNLDERKTGSASSSSFQGRGAS